MHFRECRDALLRGHAVVEHEVRIRDVDLFRKIVNGLFLLLGEHALVDLDGLDFLFSVSGAVGASGVSVSSGTASCAASVGFRVSSGIMLSLISFFLRILAFRLFLFVFLMRWMRRRHSSVANAQISAE